MRLPTASARVAPVRARPVRARPVRARLVPLALAVTVLGPLTGCGGAPASAATWPDVVARVLGPDYELRSGGEFGLDRVAVRELEGAPAGPALEVGYPEGSASQEVARETGAPQGGAQFYAALRAGPVEAGTLRYSVRFPEGFAFAKGGKLPGLYGGTATAGGRTPDGTDGFSTRYMWRRDGAGEVYAYLPGSEQVGSSLGQGSWSWPTGRWVEVEQEVVLNTPGTADGSITVRLDGREVYAGTGLDFRQTDEVRIEGVFFSTFFGGGDPSWASPRAQQVQFAGFGFTARR